MDTSIPVLVLKLENYGSLGIMRSLGRMGVPVYGVDESPRSVPSTSRFCRGSFVWDLGNALPHDSVDFLIHTASLIGDRPILIPTADETVLFVSRNAEQLRPYYRLHDQSPNLVASLCSKRGLYHLARRFGVPTPRTLFPESHADVLRYGDVLTYPVVLKGIHGARLEARTGKRMVIVNNPGELLAAYAIMEDPTSPNLMIQEYIQGSDDSAWLFNGYFSGEAECHVAYTGRKIRQNPTYTGMTSYGTCEWNQEIAETTVCFLRAIGYHGIVDIDYRFDARDGQYKLLDVNPRIGASFRLFVTESGMDVARALYLDMTSQPVSPERPKDGRTWIVEDKDLLSSYRYIRDGRLSFRQWIASLRRVDEAGYFSFDDPIPSTYMWGNHVKRKLNLLRKYSDTMRPLSTRGSQRPGKSRGETAYASQRMDVAM